MPNKQEKPNKELVLRPANGRPIKFEAINGDIQYRLLDTSINQFGPYTTFTVSEVNKLVGFLKRFGNSNDIELLREIFSLRNEINALENEIIKLKKR